MEQAKCILRLFVSPSLENCRNILSFDIYQADDRDEYNRRKGVTKVRVNRGLKRATANSLHDDVTRSAGVGEIFPNLLYPFSNVLKSFHLLLFSIYFLGRFLRKFLSSTLCQTFPPHPLRVYFAFFVSPRIIIFFVFFPFLLLFFLDLIFEIHH